MPQGSTVYFQMMLAFFALLCLLILVNRIVRRRSERLVGRALEALLQNGDCDAFDQALESRLLRLYQPRCLLADMRLLRHWYLGDEAAFFAAIQALAREKGIEKYAYLVDCAWRRYHIMREDFSSAWQQEQQARQTLNGCRFSLVVEMNEVFSAVIRARRSEDEAEIRESLALLERQIHPLNYSFYNCWYHYEAARACERLGEAAAAAGHFQEAYRLSGRSYLREKLRAALPGAAS